MHRIIHAAIVTTIFVAACSENLSDTESFLQGTWQSNSEKTLEAMRAAANISGTEKSTFENDVFGHLWVEFRGQQLRYWFDNKDFETDFRRFEIVQESGSRVVIRDWDPDSGEAEEDTLVLGDDCFRIVTTDFGFDEYFCRASGSP